MTANTPNVTPQNTENEEEVPQKAPMALIIVVVVLGIALVGMLGLIIMKIVSGDHKKKPEAGIVEQVSPAVTAESVVPTVASNFEFGDFKITQPANSKLVSYSAGGVEMYFHFELETGDNVIISLNRVTGNESRITIAK